MRATIADIARAARVSPATVDRVLNGRGGVREKTRQAVMAVAAQLGYLDDSGPIVPDGRTVTLHVLLPDGANDYIDGLETEFRRQSETLGHVTVNVERLPKLDHLAMADRIVSLAGKADGVAIVGLDHPLVAEALRGLSSKGVPVLTLASDVQNVPDRQYVGIDNFHAGRLAGLLAGRFLGATDGSKVALLSGSLAYRGHQEREMGFRQILSAEFSHLAVTEVRGVREDRALARSVVGSLVAEHPDLALIYNIGGGTIGVCEALEDAGLSQTVFLFAHDLSVAKRAHVLSGTIDAIFDQDPTQQVRESLAFLVSRVRHFRYVFIQPSLRVIFRENLPTR
jgi:LacI family transcriptional regulator